VKEIKTKPSVFLVCFLSLSEVVSYEQEDTKSKLSKCVRYRVWIFLANKEK